MIRDMPRNIDRPGLINETLPFWKAVLTASSYTAMMLTFVSASAEFCFNEASEHDILMLSLINLIATPNNEHLNKINTP